MRVLSQPLPPPGGHPLRALGQDVARPSPAAHAWAGISRHADLVEARAISGVPLDTGVWVWMPVPVNCARLVLESGALRLLTGMVKLGGAHAGRCAGCVSSCSPPRARRVNSIAESMCGVAGAAKGALAGSPSPSPAAPPPPQRAGSGAQHHAAGCW